MPAPQKTDYATVAIEDTAPQEDAASYGNEGRWLVVSEVITVVAARAWEFSVPLALLGPPGPHASLRAPAALALATTLATATLAPPTGAWADRSDRRRASRVARLAQILGTALGVLGVASLVYDGSQQNYTALGLVLLGGAVESVAAVVSKNAPKKDWAPALFDGLLCGVFFSGCLDRDSASPRRRASMTPSPRRRRGLRMHRHRRRISGRALSYHVSSSDGGPGRGSRGAFARGALRLLVRPEARRLRRRRFKCGIVGAGPGRPGFVVREVLQVKGT